MHEYSIVRALLSRVEEEAAARNAGPIRWLCVRIGELSGVEPELLAAAYEIYRERTICERAELEVESVPALWICSACGAAIARGGALTCPTCGTAARLAAGDEIILASIEMEVT